MRVDSLRVLIADDEKMIADSLAQIFRMQGFKSLAVYDGASAVQAAGIFMPDVLIADVVMPGMNGFELAIEYSTVRPACRVILFSGQTETVDLRDKAGIPESKYDVYTKPVAPQIFLNRLHIEQTLLQ